MSRVFGPIFQSGYVVQDLDAAIQHWTKNVGVGPFYVFPRIEFSECFFRGRPANIEMAVAMSYSGDTQIELIKPMNDVPSIYSEFTAAGHQGLHHVGILSDHYSEDLKRITDSGREVIQGGRTKANAGFAYFESDPAFPGTMVELIEASPNMHSFFAKLKAEAQTWDGVKTTRVF